MSASENVATQRLVIRIVMLAGICRDFIGAAPHQDPALFLAQLVIVHGVVVIGEQGFDPEMVAAGVAGAFLLLQGLLSRCEVPGGAPRPGVSGYGRWRSAGSPGSSASRLLRHPGRCSRPACVPHSRCG